MPMVFSFERVDYLTSARRSIFSAVFSHLPWALGLQRFRAFVIAPVTFPAHGAVRWGEIMPLSLPDERFTRCPVKGLMSRVRHAFILLMPAAFWLFASGQSVLV